VAGRRRGWATGRGFATAAAAGANQDSTADI